MSEKKSGKEKDDPLLKAKYEPWTITIINGKKYIADAEGKLHPQQIKKERTKRKIPVIKTIPVHDRLKYDIAEYHDLDTDKKSYALRFWTFDKSGKSTYLSKQGKELPRRKMPLPNDIDLIHQIGNALLDLAFLSD